MSLLFPDDLILEPDDTEVARAQFVAGVRAAFIVSQLNRLGQVLCGVCGKARNDLRSAFNELEVIPWTRFTGAGYQGGLEWGDDHPSNLVLVCKGCCRPS